MSFHVGEFDFEIDQKNHKRTSTTPSTLVTKCLLVVHHYDQASSGRKEGVWIVLLN
jgi:hypothetical protein